MSRKALITSFSLSLYFLVLSLPLWSGVTGKIVGEVVDKEDKELLVGVNILIDGMLLGASTDADGNYFILQVPPGTYSLTISYLGYSDVRIENVHVSVDHTTRVDVELEENILNLNEEIVIIAKRPFIQKDVTSSTQFVGAKELKELPVSDLKEGIFLQAGVLFDGLPAIGAGGKGEARYSIRGGSQDEVVWFVDGVRTASSIEAKADRGGSFTSMNMNAVQEVQVITGGFNSEYGNAQSGIVNVITKEGQPEFTGSLEYLYGMAGQHHFGNYIYDQKTQKEFLDNRLPDGTLDPTWWTDYRKSQTYDYTKIPDKTIFASLGGPLFRMGDISGTFFISSQFKKESYSYPHPRDTRDLQNIIFTSAFTFGYGTKLKITGLYNHEGHSTLQEGFDFTSQAKYYRGWGSLLDTRTYSLSTQWNQALSNELFYDLKLSWTFFDFKEQPSKFTVLGNSANPTIWGYDRYDGFENELFDAYTFLYKSHTQNGDLSLVGSFNWQFNNENLLKSGLEMSYHTLNEIESTRYPSFSDHPDDWMNRGLHEKFHPLQFAYYIQDKMEFESMILNVGLRYDYFNPNRDWFKKTSLFNMSVNPHYDAPLTDEDQIDSEGRMKYSFQNVLDKPREPSKTYHMVSPRLGVSFPITENTLMHFNYGHFYQMPPLDRMFEFTYFRPEYFAEAFYNARQNGTPITHYRSSDGDPERVIFLTLEPLKPEKTIMFEVGLKQNFDDLATLAVTAYYKDVFDQNEPRAGLFDRRIYGFDPFRNSITPNTFYVSTFPGDYGDSRGFEISVHTLFSPVFTFDVNYSFSISTQGRASPGRINIDQNGNETLIYDEDVSLRIPTEKSFSRPHILRANLFLRYPSNSTTLIDKLFHNSSASILYKYISGQAFTYLEADDPPDTYDNHRFPGIQTIDLRLEKTIDFWMDNSITIYSRITNLFNTKNLRSYGDIYFDTNSTKDYVENGKISRVDGAGYDISYQTYYEPRRVYFGLRYNF